MRPPPLDASIRLKALPINALSPGLADVGRRAHISTTKGPAMAENPSAAPLPNQAGTQQHLRSLALLSYVLFLVSFFNGLTAIVGVIIAYIKRRDATGTVWQSHFDNLILVFWVMLAICLVGLISFPISLVSLTLWFSGDFVWPAFSVFALPVLVWMVALPILVIWFFYRMIRGLIHASENRPY
jgi:uncharacterized membrane protein